MPETRVLHLTFDMHIGGAERVIRNLVEYTDPAQYQTQVMCLEEPIGPFGEILIEQGYSVDAIARRQGFDFSVVRRLRKHLIGRRIDILHCHQYTPWAYGALAALTTRTRVIFTEHGRFYPDRTSWKRRFINPVLLRMSSAVTSICHATSRALVEYEYIPDHRISVIYNGIEALETDAGKSAGLLDELDIPRGCPVIGTVARLDPVKNQSLLLRGFRQVMDRFPDTYLVIVGDGPEMTALRQLASELGIESNTRFTGYVSRPEHHLMLMDIFLLPSLTEGTSMTLLEAMSIGKPCVVSDAGGNPEIIEHRYNGLVFENDDLAGFVAAISELLADGGLIRQMGENARTRFDEQFTAEKMTLQFEQLYRQVKS